MKQFKLFCAIFVVALMTSCGGLSKSDALKIITEERTIDGTAFTVFSSKATPIDDLSSTEYDLYKKYEEAGLISMEESLKRIWGDMVNTVQVTVTEAGQEALKANETSVVDLYNYKLDQVEDIVLVDKKVSPIDSKNYQDTYLVFVTGSIDGVTCFGAAEGLKDGDRYPLPIKDEPTLKVYTLILDYQNDAISRTRIRSNTIWESEKEATIEEANELD